MPETPSNLEVMYINKAMEDSYLNYAMSVIVGRALPDVRDGLKPVHRRILYAMFEESNFHNRPFKKSARTVGNVIGKYHPHGDTAVYDTLVRMAQPFSMASLLVDGQGNFGSIDGDAPAAMRYTEARMTELSSELFNEIRQETVRWNENYDGSEKEPEVLTAKFPQLLVNGGSGIAVGMASYIPPHNLNDVIDATVALIGNPELSFKEFGDLLKSPDFPTAGLVYMIDGFHNAVETGSGRMRLRSKFHEEKRGRDTVNLIITELPYQVNKAKLLENIANLVRAKTVEDIVEIRDESDGDGIRVVIGLKKGMDAETMFSILAGKKSVQLETSISYNCVVIDGGRPKILGLKEIAQKWIDFRKDIVLKKYIFLRKKETLRLEILNGLLAALGLLDETIKTIRASNSRSEASLRIIELLSINERQASAILDMRLNKLTGLEIEALNNEHDSVTARLADLSLKISSPELIQADIVEELHYIKDKYGFERKTEIGYQVSNISREDLVPQEEVLISITQAGYVKRMPANTLKTQNRGTRGKRSLEVYEDDNILNLYQVHSHDMLMVFDTEGQVYGTKAYNIPEGGASSKGTHIRNIIEDFDKEVAAIVVAPESEDSYVLTVNSSGYVKRTSVTKLTGATRKGGVLGVDLASDDKLIAAFGVSDKHEVVLVSDEGKAIRFKVSDVRPMGRKSRGVGGMRLDDGFKVIGAHVMTPEEAGDQFLFVIGDTGVGKKTSLSEYSLQNRNGRGVKTIRMTKKTGKIVSAMGVSPDKNLVMLSEKGISNMIKVSDISAISRDTSGVILMNLDDGDTLKTVTQSIQIEDEESE